MLVVCARRVRLWSLNLLAVCLLAPMASAQVLIDWVSVGDPVNSCDTQPAGCFGTVAEYYRISKFEVTNDQYTAFLNAVAATDTNALFNTLMSNATPPNSGGITRSGISGSYTYSTLVGREDLPVNRVSFYDSLRFANWLHNGQPTGAQDSTTTEDGAYTMIVETYPGTVITRNAGAKVYLTSEDEWYKAAYYIGGSPTAGYWDYPAGSDTQTTCSVPGATANTANCSPAVADLTDAGSYTGSASPYGTFDQGGNVFEWNEAILLGSARGVLGGDFDNGPERLDASDRGGQGPGGEFFNVGFRLASPFLNTIDQTWDGGSGLLPDQFSADWLVTDTATPEDPSLAGGILTLATDVNLENIAYTQLDSTLVIPNQLEVEFEVKYISGTTSVGYRAPIFLSITTDDNAGISLFIADDNIFLTSAENTVGESAIVDTNDDFHIYKLLCLGTSAGSTVLLYHDDVLTLSGTLFTQAASARIAWGEGSTLASGVSEWKRVTHNAAAACTSNAECNDAIACTLDICDMGICTNVPNHALCSDGVFCNGAEVCDASVGCIFQPLQIDDGNLCTTDSCDESFDIVVHDPVTDGTSCDLDGVPCSQDTCTTGVCLTALNHALCSDGVFCNGAEVCAAGVGCVSQPLQIDDGNSCTADSCDEASDIVIHDPVADGTSCDPDGIGCTQELCTAGACLTTLDHAQCDDGVFCTGAEVCDAGTGCVSQPLQVDDGVSCTIDSCDENNETVTHAPSEALCDDNNPCTAESCDAITGCGYSPVSGCGAEVPTAGTPGSILVVLLLLAAGALFLGIRNDSHGIHHIR